MHHHPQQETDDAAPEKIKLPCGLVVVATLPRACCVRVPDKIRCVYSQTTPWLISSSQARHEMVMAPILQGRQEPARTGLREVTLTVLPKKVIPVTSSRVATGSFGILGAHTHTHTPCRTRPGKFFVECMSCFQRPLALSTSPKARRSQTRPACAAISDPRSSSRAWAWASPPPPPKRAEGSAPTTPQFANRRIRCSG